MEIKKTNTIASSIKTNDHPYLKDAWIPNYDEYEVTDLEALGGVPEDIEGAYFRNTENQVHEPIGRFHPFDGDGMVHSINFDNGKANYVNKFVRTEGFLVEQEMGKSMWAGLMEKPSASSLPGWGAQGGIKDSSSTDITIHGGAPLSTFYQCGEGYQLNPFTLDTEKKLSWVPSGGLSAHPKVDLATGELLFFNYSKQAPYLHYGVVDEHQNLKHFIPVELPGPRLPHDMAFSKNYSILNDLPLFWDQEMLKKGVHATRLHDLPSRFAVIPRYGNPEDIKWFEADPTYVLHWNNAYEVGDELILEGYFQEHPWPENYIDSPTYSVRRGHRWTKLPASPVSASLLPSPGLGTYARPYRRQPKPKEEDFSFQYPRNTELSAPCGRLRVKAKIMPKAIPPAISDEPP